MYWYESIPNPYIPTAPSYIGVHKNPSSINHTLITDNPERSDTAQCLQQQSLAPLVDPPLICSTSTNKTGIFGRQIVFEFSQHRIQWPTIHALSRSKKEDYPDNVIHNYIDLLSSPDEMVSDLKSVRGSHIFFAPTSRKKEKKTPGP
jgi:hypothetical protein